MQISVPHCYLPNTKHQVFDMDTCNRTLFQIQTLKNISQHTDFAYFIGIGSKIVYPEFKSKFWCVWVDKQGGYHALSIGLNRILCQTINNQDNIVSSEDSPVYACRCN